MSTHTTHAPPSDLSHGFRAPFPAVGMFRENLSELRASWGWFVALGVVLMILGAAAISASQIASAATALVFAGLMLGAGVAYLIGAFFTRSWGGFFMSLLAGVLHLAVGAIILDRPLEALLVYTLLLAALFFVEGVVQIIGSIAGRFYNWGWALMSGIVSLALGVLIWRQWPLSGLYVVGLFVGINLAFHGATFFMVGLGMRRLPAQ